MSDSRGQRPKGRARASLPVRKHGATRATRGDSAARPRGDKQAPAAGSRRHRIRSGRAAPRTQSKESSVTRRKANRNRAADPAPRAASRIERRRAVSRRRAKLVAVGCLALCALVLATSFPVSALMRQHRQISAATSELQALTSENESLQTQAGALSQPANVAALARRDYDLVRPGQTAYTVLPLPGSLEPPADLLGAQLTRPGSRGPGVGAVRGPPR